MPIQWAVGAMFVIYMVSTWFMGSLIKLTGSDLWIFRGALSALGITSYAVFYWWLNKRQAAKSAQQSSQAGGGGAAAEGPDEVVLLVREAEKRLSASRLSEEVTLGRLPVFLLMGEAGSTKTTTMVHSGLEPELLAGHVYQEKLIAPTRSANIWFARKSVFLEAGGRLLAEPMAWVRLLKKLQPPRLRSIFAKAANAPRAALLCFDGEQFTKPGAQDALTVTARGIQARLGEISQTLGINFPVYVLFTRMDRLQFFSEFVRNLSNDEASQVFGVTLPVRASRNGVYAEEETQRLSTAFNQLFYSLCDKRIVFLPRENDGEKLPAAYEFPREFRKYRAMIVQLLVDVCRPSQLRANPFLRGFYFSGVRAVVLSDAAPTPMLQRPAAPAFDPHAGATGMFHSGAAQPGPTPQAPMQAQPTGARKVPQWLFLSHLFNDVLLQDKAAMGASGSSVKASLQRRILLGAAALFALVFSVGMTVSFFGNRALESRVIQAAQAAPNEAAGINLASVESLRKLETLRQSLEELTLYEQEGPPLRLRWFLYAGSAMYPHVRRIYYNRFWALMFGHVQAAMLDSLRRLPNSPGATDEYGPAYDTLKAYLITTSHHYKSTRPFLSPYLMNRWLAEREIDPERRQLAEKQFDFYSEDLKRANPFSSENDGMTVSRTRCYLAQFSALERIYRSMLAAANAANPTVNFNKRFPGSAEVVINNRDVVGAFTKPGWAFMMNALKKADQYYAGEEWVLEPVPGGCPRAGLAPARLQDELLKRYTADFIAAWRAYFKNSYVVRYASLRDASNKLAKTSGNQSPLMALFWLGSYNTNVDSQAVKDAFDAPHKVVPPSDVMQFVGGPNTNYMGSLVSLQTGIDQAAGIAGGPDPATAERTFQLASTAKSATGQLAQTFRYDQEGRVDSMSKQLMLDPITHAEALLRGVGPAELNAKAKALCAGFTMMNKFPFNPNARDEATLIEVATVFRPREGTLWQFYESTLRNLLARQGSEYVPTNQGGIRLTEQFVRFFNQAAKFSEALYPGNVPDIRLAYSLRPLPSDQIESMTLVIDGRTATYALASDTAPRQYIWPGTTAQELKLTGRLAGGLQAGLQNRQGLWSVFRFFADADTFTPGGGAYTLMWVFRSGREGQPMEVLGKPLTYRFVLDTGGAPAVFHKDFLASLRCISQAAR